MPSTMSLRVGDDLLLSAKLAADASGRSAAQQIGYWAKLGRELERSGSVSVREIAEVLAGARSYDELGPKEQAHVRVEWDLRIEARRRALDLARRFEAEGRSWVELDAGGATVRHAPVSESKRVSAPDKTAARTKASTRNASARKSTHSDATTPAKNKTPARGR